MVIAPLICDASGLLAYCDNREPDHEDVVRVMTAEPGPFVISPLVLAEIDHFLNTRYHVDAQLAVIENLSGPGWQMAPLGSADLGAARAVIARYRDQRIGLTDASLVVLAERYRTDRILTLDRRHFSVLRTRSGAPFTLLP